MIRYLIIFFVFLVACKKLFQDDVLSIPQTNYLGNELRTDGYYYESLNNNTYFIVYVFYKNGTILCGQTFTNSTLDTVEKRLVSDVWLSSLKNIKYCWGRFLIENNKIKFERWYPGRFPQQAYVREGDILNDTTFVITESYRMRNGNKTEHTTGRNEVYHFKQFSPKPDSTNIYVP